MAGEFDASKVIYRNDTLPALPPNKTYTEYKVPTPEYPGTGPERIVVATEDGMAYYTGTHYKTWIDLTQ